MIENGGPAYGRFGWKADGPHTIASGARLNVVGLITDTTATARVSRFDNKKQFGFVKLDNRLDDAFLHINVLKDGRFYFLPRATRVKVRVEPDRGKYRVVEVLHVDKSTAQHGEPPPLVRRPKEA